MPGYFSDADSPEEAFAVPPPPDTEPAWAAILSKKPYSSASVAVNHLSRSLSLRMVYTVWPVCSAVSSAMTFFMCRMSSAWILMSEAVPPMPPEGWCIRTRAFGVA
jgi:hypothetical protein